MSGCASAHMTAQQQRCALWSSSSDSITDQTGFLVGLATQVRAAQTECSACTAHNPAPPPRCPLPRRNPLPALALYIYPQAQSSPTRHQRPPQSLHRPHHPPSCQWTFQESSSPPSSCPSRASMPPSLSRRRASSRSRPRSSVAASSRPGRTSLRLCVTRGSLPLL